MNTLRNILLSTLVLLTFSCNKDEDKDTDPDYSVLGITSVSINDEQISVTGGSLLNVDQHESIVMDGLENQKTHKHLRLSYVVTANTDTDLSIEVDSNYNDVNVSYSQETDDNQTAYIAVVTREGFEEQITYVFHRLIISENK